MKKMFIALTLSLITTSVFADALSGKLLVKTTDSREKIQISSGNKLSLTSKDFLEICGYSRDAIGSYLNGTYSLSKKDGMTIITIKITSPCNATEELGGIVVEEKGLQNIVFANAEGGIVFQEKSKK